MKNILRLIVLLFVSGLLIILSNYFLQASTVYDGAVKLVKGNSSPVFPSRLIECKTISHKKGMIDSAAFADLTSIVKENCPNLSAYADWELFENHSFLIHIDGADADLKPLVLLAHMDVVPVPKTSYSDWEHPPFKGVIDDGYIWGRGALDDKTSFAAILQAVENLLKDSFEFNRSVYLVFGHDEEIGGTGAKAISEYLEEKGVEAEIVLDEGGYYTKGLIPGIDETIALVGLAEKGYMSIDLVVNTEAGHSSMPSYQSSLEVLIDAVKKLRDNPFEPRISEPLDGFIKEVGPNLPFAQSLAFSNRWLFESLILNAYSKGSSSFALVHTTQTPTIFKSGLKDNVIPKRAIATINYRLLPGDLPADVIERVKDLIDDDRVKIQAHGGMDPVKASEVSPYNSINYRKLASLISASRENCVVAPYLMIGASDARYFYNISDEVYRFSPYLIGAEDVSRIHGVNERISISDYNSSVNFYMSLIHTFNE